MLRGFFLKAVYDLPTTKVLIENLKTSPSLRRLCGWEYKGQVPSEATFSRGFKEFAARELLALMHDVLVSENYKEKVVGHASMDSTAIIGRETELEPASKICYRERSTVERGNSDLKDNYGARHIRVKGHWKVFCHLMFGVVAVTVKQLFNMLC